MKTKTHSKFFHWLLLVVSAILLNTTLNAAPLAWFPGPTLGTPMSGSATVVNRGNNILTGGDADEYYYYPLSEPLSLAATNSDWSYLSPYYDLNIAGGAVVSDGNLVIYGGTDGTNSQSITVNYSLTGDTTPTLPDLNAPRSYFGYAPDRTGNAYAFGGLDANGNPLATCERLNPTANTPAWTYIANLPQPRFNFPAVFNHTNYIYLFGGITDPATGIETNSVLRYSISGNSWSNLAPMPIAVAGSAATLGPDGNIYVIGGTIGGVSSATVQVYNPTSNSWSLSTPLPEGLTLAAAGVDSLNRLIVMGGMDENGYDVSDVWRSQPFGVADSSPVFTNFPAISGVYLGTYSSSIIATGNPQPIYTLVSGPAGLQVDYYTGVITWSPQTLDQIGSNPVTIEASNYAGSTNYTFIISVPNPPPATPANLTLVSTTESSVSFSWSPVDPSAGAVTYSFWLRHVSHSPKGSGDTVWYTQIGSSTADTNFTISGLGAGLSQSYYLQASGPGGISGYAAVSAATLPAPPPTNLHVVALTSTSVTLAWTPPVGGFPTVSYEILGWYNGIAAQYPLAIPNIPGNVTSLPITGLASGTAMLWGISATDSTGNVTAWDYLEPLVINPQPQPATLAAIAGPTAFGFQFSVQPSASQTTIIQATTNLSAPSAWMTIATNPPTGTSFIFTDTSSSQFSSRYYRVISP